MNNNKLQSVSSYYCIIVGIFNLISWGFLIISGSVSDFHQTPIAYIFHWLSEFTTAFLLIYTGIAIRRGKGYGMNLLFLSLGFLLIAIGGAFVFYLFNFEIIIFIISALITGITIIFIILNYQSHRQLIFLTNGITLYALINILGQGIQEMNLSLISMSVLSLGFVLSLTVILWNKEIVFKYIRKKKTK